MILYFSGCGNSARVAKELSSALADTNVVRLFGKTLAEAEVGVPSGDRVVWVFPVYSWGVPPVVADFIGRVDLTGADNAEHHLVVTCGDDAGLVDRQWRKLIGRRGWTAKTASTIVMPNTYTLMKGFDVDPADVAERKLCEAGAAVAKCAGRILSGSSEADMVRGSFAWIKSRVVYPWFIRYAMSPKPFRSLDGCISCGKCASVCPMGNIAMRGGRPQWGSSCALCLACYNACPTHSVAYGKATRGKGQYFLDS